LSLFRNLSTLTVPLALRCVRASLAYLYCDYSISDIDSNFYNFIVIVAAITSIITTITTTTTYNYYMCYDYYNTTIQLLQDRLELSSGTSALDIDWSHTV